MKKSNEVLFFEYTSSFLDVYLRLQMCRSNNTIESYRDSLTIFRRFLLDEKKIKITKFKMIDCNKDLILDFIDYLKTNERKTSTINHHIAAIKSYLYYVSLKDISFQSIQLSIGRIPSLRQTKYVKECLSPELLKALFNHPKSNKIGIRNRMIMILLYETAIRVGELINISMKDIILNVKEPYILIHGKGDKERIVVLSSKCVEHIKHYISLFHNNQKCQYLFYTTIKGISDKLSESTIETFIQKYANELRQTHPNMPHKVHPHMFRRTRATHLYQDNIPLELVSRILGHSSTETTKIYATPSLKQMKKAIENENDINIKEEWENDDEIAKLFGIR